MHINFFAIFSFFFLSQHKGFLLIILAVFSVDLSTQQQDDNNSTSKRDGKGNIILVRIILPIIAKVWEKRNYENFSQSYAFMLTNLN